MKLIAGNSNIDLAKSISSYIGGKLANAHIRKFVDGEIFVKINENIRGENVFIIQSTAPPANDHLMELLITIDAAKRASARHITAVIPYFGWARQDRKDKPRVPIAAKMIAGMIESAGATRVMTMDLHADQIQGFFQIPVDHLYASTIFMPYIQELKLDNLCIASPDMGGSKRAYAYAKALNSDVVVCYKQRKKANIISHMELIGDVIGKNVVLIDDMVDTAGTLAKAGDLITERGAKSVRAVCTHALLSANAYEKIEKSRLLELIVTDTVPKIKSNSKIKVLSCADLFADVMHNVHNNESISSKFIM